MSSLYGNMLNEFDHEDFMERTHSTGSFLNIFQMKIRDLKIVKS